MPLLNKAGGAGFQVTAYTQTWSDVEARIGSRPKAGQIAGNFNTLLMMRAMRPNVPERLEDLAARLKEHGDKSDLMESRAAFAEKRAPVFRGRFAATR